MGVSLNYSGCFLYSRGVSLKYFSSSSLYSDEVAIFYTLMKSLSSTPAVPYSLRDLSHPNSAVPSTLGKPLSTNPAISYTLGGSHSTTAAVPFTLELSNSTNPAVSYTLV
jgi:hypothetical protein